MHFSLKFFYTTSVTGALVDFLMWTRTQDTVRPLQPEGKLLVDLAVDTVLAWKIKCAFKGDQVIFFRCNYCPFNKESGKNHIRPAGFMTPGGTLITGLKHKYITTLCLYIETFEFQALPYVQQT